MREFVNEGRKLLGLGLSGENGNPSAVADAKRGGDLLAEDKLNVLGLDERNETVVVLSTVPLIWRMAGSSAPSVCETSKT